MSVPGVSTGPFADVLSGGIRDFGDVALAVAILQMETLDGEIVTRLREMQQLNEVRKAYTDRITELNAMMQSIGNRKEWVRADQNSRLDYEWDAQSGEVVARSGSGLGSQSKHQVTRSDGTDLTWRDIAEIAETDGDGTILDEMLAEYDRTHPHGTWDVGPDGETRIYPRDPFETPDAREAAQVADAAGGEVVTWTKVNKEAITAEIDRIRGTIDGLSSDTEIGMLKLNRLLNHRNQALQIASNVMSSSHQSAMAIINNLRV